MNEPAVFDNPNDVCPTKDCFFHVCPNNSKYEVPDAYFSKTLLSCLKCVLIIHIYSEAVWVQKPGNQRLSYHTLCMETRQGENDKYLHYDVHSLYALTETKHTRM